MPMVDYHQGGKDAVTQPARRCFVITPHDANELEMLPKSLRAPSDGIIMLRAVDSNTDVAHPVIAGEIVFVRAQYVRATGTTVVGTIVGYA